MNKTDSLLTLLFRDATPRPWSKGYKVVPVPENIPLMVSDSNIYSSLSNDGFFYIIERKGLELLLSQEAEKANVEKVISFKIKATEERLKEANRLDAVFKTAWDKSVKFYMANVLEDMGMAVAWLKLSVKSDKLPTKIGLTEEEVKELKKGVRA